MDKKKKTITKKITSKKTPTTKKATKIHHDKFLFNALLFVAIVAIFNFVFYIFNDEKDFVSYIANNNKTQNQNLFIEQDPNSNIYSNSEIAFSYPKGSKIEGDNDSLNIDNWGIDFYNKNRTYSNFEKWFNNNFEEKNCLIKSMNSDKDENFSYSLYFVDGVNCNNNGLFMVGNKKIGKIILGVNPDGSYEQVLASIKF